MTARQRLANSARVERYQVCTSGAGGYTAVRWKRCMEALYVCSVRWKRYHLSDNFYTDATTFTGDPDCPEVYTKKRAFSSPSTNLQLT